MEMQRLEALWNVKVRGLVFVMLFLWCDCFLVVASEMTWKNYVLYSSVILGILSFVVLLLLTLKVSVKVYIQAIFFLSWFAVKFKDKAQILNDMARGKVENKKKEKSGEGEILPS